MNSKEMNINVIRTASGDSWQVTGQQVVAVRDEHLGLANIFDVVELREAHVALRTFHGTYVSAKEWSADALAKHAGNYETFSLEKHGDRVSFGTADGHYLIIRGDGRLGVAGSLDGDATAFLLEPHPELLVALQSPCRCCEGRLHQVTAGAPVWDDKQHLRVMDGGITALTRIPNDAEPWGRLWHDARRILDLIPENAAGEYSGPIYEGMAKGIYDADYQDQYGGTYPVFFGIEANVYYKHFYDPVTGTTFANRPQNARTECQRYFDESLRLGSPERANAETRRAIGYRFGLALHYFTDLTQPMHVANFKNYIGYQNLPGAWYNLAEKRHSNFETYADPIVFPVRPGYSVRQLSPAEWGAGSGAGSIAHSVATCSRNLYDRGGLRELVESKWPWGQFGDEAKPLVGQCIDHGYFHTGMFLLYWAQQLPR